MADRFIPWGELSPDSQEQHLQMQRALFQDPDWTPPEDYAVQVIELPADFFDELDADHFADHLRPYMG